MLIRCRVCEKEFDPVIFMDHLTAWNEAHTGGTFPNKEHAIPKEVQDKIVFNRDEPCYFCGGYVRHDAHRIGEDDVGWEISCDQCGYLYDED